jgi:acyl dehydratase
MPPEGTDAQRMLGQRYWEDVQENDAAAPVDFPLSLYRLVMMAGAVRDFSSIHHNEEIARWHGAPNVFANNTAVFIMWERALRDYIGLAGTITQVRGLRMRSFNLVGDCVTVKASVTRKWLDEDDAEQGHVELSIQTESSSGDITVGPGHAIVTLPRRPPGT